MKKIDKFADKLNWVNYIGKEIEKHSGKPFKSGDKIAIPISIETNPYSGKEGFKLGDNTIVDCMQCKLVTINAIV